MLKDLETCQRVEVRKAVEALVEALCRRGFKTNEGPSLIFLMGASRCKALHLPPGKDLPDTYTVFAGSSRHWPDLLGQGAG